MNQNHIATVTTSSLMIDKTIQSNLSTNKNNCASKLLRAGKLVTIILIIALVSSHVQAAKMLFRSNFGNGVSISAPYSYFPTGNGAWQQITGTDKETGYSWPVRAFGSNFSGLQLITMDSITSSTIGDYITNEIRSVSGPKGKTTNEIFQNVKIKGDVGEAGSQSPFVFLRPSTIGDVKDLYMTYWIKYPADLAEKLDPTISSGNWRTHFEFKTGGYGGNTSSGDYRSIINIMKDSDGSLYWLSRGDSNANGPVPFTTYWREENRVVPVPVGEWIKFEVYWHRSSGSDGRFWAAVNGQEIVDYHGPNMGDYNLPITRIMPHNAYSGGSGPVESHITGFEIWDGFPCGSGVSCYNFDTTAPTVPASPKGTFKKYSTFASTTLTWAASTDAIGVAGYAIYRNGIKIGVSSTTTSYTDVIVGSATGSLYSYTVKAFDAAENFSSSSSAVKFTY
ncbi:hypothetical protein [Nitrosomonas sp.]|uniref:hypothetical protein n=1 Tax=Nitrosomonas sp. TaxID=42353 RepID=UPI001D841F78|nr:hypothetical protein [Nitrosomonas sp.]MBX3618197.1 hypothetical protein [Nitrosomonas sp.]